MSFSFSAQAATKEEVKAKVAAAMDEVVQSQPTHERDRDLVVQTASAYIDAVDPQEGDEINCYVSGSVSWNRKEDGSEYYSNVSVQVSASLSKPPKAV